MGRKDGSLMLAQDTTYRVSNDGGATWDESRPLQAPIGAAGMIRLQSGAFTIYGRKGARYCLALLVFNACPEPAGTRQ